MKPKRFQRRENTRTSYKLFVIATEGSQTEPTYFRALKTFYSTITVECLESKKHDSAPQYVLERMQQWLEEQDLGPRDEAWVVVDRDSWSPAVLVRLQEWSETQENYGFVVSNPHFEYWLLLHFEAGDNVGNKSACLNRLKKHLPHYEKSKLDMNKLRPGIASAVKRAKKRDKHEDSPWPKSTGTTVYKLVERIIAAGEATS